MSYYERHLPHWHPEGAMLFVTWRLHGSLPSCLLGGAFAEMERLLDAAATGPQWLGEERIARVVIETLGYAERQLRLFDSRAWVIMPNHVHLLLQPLAPLARITRSIKSYSGRKANEILGLAKQPFWQHESYDHWVRDRYEAEKIIRYVERNPVKAGLAAVEGEWPWSSAWDKAPALSR